MKAKLLPKGLKHSVPAPRPLDLSDRAVALYWPDAVAVVVPDGYFGTLM
jgi:hypothetical protein